MELKHWHVPVNISKKVDKIPFKMELRLITIKMRLKISNLFRIIRDFVINSQKQMFNLIQKQTNNNKNGLNFDKMQLISENMKEYLGKKKNCA